MLHAFYCSWSFILVYFNKTSILYPLSYFCFNHFASELNIAFLILWTIPYVLVVSKFPHHYCLACPNYLNIRTNLSNVLNPICTPSTEINSVIFKHVQLFIKQSYWFCFLTESMSRFLDGFPISLPLRWLSPCLLTTIFEPHFLTSSITINYVFSFLLCMYTFSLSNA